MSQILRRDWLPEIEELYCPLGITRCPFARHGTYTNNAILFFDFPVVLGEKTSTKCSENSQHLHKEKERDMKSSCCSVNFVLGIMNR